MNNVKEKNNGSKVGSQVKGEWSTEAKAQYEVYRNGNLSRDTIAQWIRNDLSAVISFSHGCLDDKLIFDALVNAFYARYEKLHGEKHDEVVKAMENDKS